MPTETTAPQVPTELTALWVLPEQTARWVRKARLVRLVRQVRLGRRAPRVKRETLGRLVPTPWYLVPRVRPETLDLLDLLVLRGQTPPSQVLLVKPVPPVPQARPVLMEPRVKPVQPVQLASLEARRLSRELLLPPEGTRPWALHRPRQQRLVPPGLSSLVAARPSRKDRVPGELFPLLRRTLRELHSPEPLLSR